MTKHTCKRHQATAAAEPEGFAQWWAQWPSRTVAAGRRAHYAEAYDARREEIALLRGLRHDAMRALVAWDGTVLPKARDGLMQERMECLRAALAGLGA